MSFVDEHGCWNDGQRKAAIEVESLVRKTPLEVIRLSVPDQHGVLRGKTVIASELAGALQNGITFVSSLLLKDTSHRSVVPVFTAGAGLGLREFEGAADILMIPDPLTFKRLPWAPHTGWMLCDLYFADGRPVPFATRQLCRSALNRLNGQGYDYVAGLEVEFHIYMLENPRLAPGDAGQPGPAPEISLLNQGYQLLTEQHYDRFDAIYEILRRDLQALGLPLRSMEVEIGPSQAEFTLRPGLNLDSADAMILLRSAVKQICRRHGYHATFMCRPKLPNACSSGWHLHQSLRRRDGGNNVFVPEGGEMPLSPTGMHYLGGLLANGAASAAFATPTINGYRRYRPYALAPDRVIWGRDNRGAMIRVLGAPGDAASRIENRIGEPAANPYLYLGSQILAGLDGMARQLDPGPSADTPYEAKAELLPRSLGEALAALRDNACFREGFGQAFVDYFIRIKEAEIARFNLEVSEWEQREYFDLF
ncbi:MAG: glutamine synthetase [Alphaproteobacteria bacterium]|nr:glutamine synthetase [Alphaproteobacteria bacterium]